MMTSMKLLYAFTNPYILSVVVDLAGIGSLIAAATAFIALYLGWKTNQRTATNTEEVSYVDNNLKTMQATLDLLTRDNERLRQLNEEQRLQIEAFTLELQEVEEKLEKCQQLCSGLSRRLNKFGAEHEREQ